MKIKKQYIKFDEFLIKQEYDNGYKIKVLIDRSYILSKLGLTEKTVTEIVKG